MNQSDRKAFCEVVIGFAELKGKQLSAPAIELYWRAMQRWSLEDFRAAAEQLLRSCEFMPTPKEFEALRRAGAPTASEAWDLVVRHTKGAYRDGSGIDDGGPIDRAVAGLGGYKAIAFHDIDYLPIMQRQFVERFGEQADVESVRESLPQLANLGSRTFRLGKPQ